MQDYYRTFEKLSYFEKNIVPGRETIPGGVKYLLCLPVYYPASRQGVFMESQVCVCVFIPTESLATSPRAAAKGCLRAGEAEEAPGFLG